MTSHRARETASHRCVTREKAGREVASIRIDLDPQETRLLREVLNRDLTAIRTEIAGIDWQDLGPEVLVTEALLQRLINGLVA